MKDSRKHSFIDLKKPIPTEDGKHLINIRMFKTTKNKGR